MKKVMVILLVLALSAAFITGCNDMKSQPPTEQSTQDVQQTTSVADVDKSKFIGEEKAKEIALEKAGISSEGVIFDRTELDFDNGVWEYEVEFRQGAYEYDADIKAENGDIISFKSEYDN